MSDQTQCFREGQLLKHKRTNLIVRLEGIVKVKRQAYDGKMLAPIYRYVLKGINDGHGTEVLHAKAMLKDWSVLLEPSSGSSKENVKKALKLAQDDEDYELCAILRDQLKVM